MKKQVTPHSDILCSCQVSQQTNVLGDTDWRYNVSVQSIWILKAVYKEKNSQPAAQQWSLVWSKAQGSGLLGSMLLLPCQQHEGRYQLNRSYILKDFSNLRHYLAHVNPETILMGPHGCRPGRTPRLTWSPGCTQHSLRKLPASSEIPTLGNAGRLRSSSHAALFPRSLSTGFHNPPVIQLASGKNVAKCQLLVLHFKTRCAHVCVLRQWLLLGLTRAMQ